MSASAERFANGLVFGTPVLNEIQSRGDPAVVAARLAKRLGELGGVAPYRSPVRKLVASARA